MQAFFYNFRMTTDNVPFCSAEVRRWVAELTIENRNENEMRTRVCMDEIDNKIFDVKVQGF